jgi:hypothetical protein
LKLNFFYKLFAIKALKQQNPYRLRTSVAKGL